LNLSPYEIALIAGGFTIIGVLLGAWIGYKNALKLYNIVEFNKATTIFRNAFSNELIFLKHNAIVGKMGSTDNLGECLRAGYIARHLKAFEIFKTYLTPKERMAIEKKWEKYCNFAQYSDKANEVELKKLAIERIEEILKFAEHR
jgi:hypothetical protein